MYEKFIARQPLFEKLRVFAYELLFRSGPENFFKPQKQASSSVIVDSTMLFDLQTLTGNAKAFINLDLASLQRGAARLLPPSRVVIETLESIVPTPEVEQLCKDLCASGYELALDDYVSHAKWEQLLPLVKFLKVDFRGADSEARAAIVRLHKGRASTTRSKKSRHKPKSTKPVRPAIPFSRDIFPANPRCSEPVKSPPTSLSTFTSSRPFPLRTSRAKRQRNSSKAIRRWSISSCAI